MYRYHSFYRSLAIISSRSLKLWNKKWILKPQAYSIGNPGAGVSVAAVASPSHDDLVNQWENHGFLDEIRCWMTQCRIHPMPCLPSSTSPFFFAGIPKPSPTLVVVAGFPYSLFILVTINRKTCFWLVVSTILKEGLSHILWKIKFMFETTKQIYYSPCFVHRLRCFSVRHCAFAPFAPRCHEIHQVRHLLLRPLLRLRMAIGEHHFSIYRL